jgi:hypothetical protein
MQTVKKAGAPQSSGPPVFFLWQGNKAVTFIVPAGINEKESNPGE